MHFIVSIQSKVLPLAAIEEFTLFEEKIEAEMQVNQALLFVPTIHENLGITL